MAKVLESRDLFSGGSLENRFRRPKVLWRTVSEAPKFPGEAPNPAKNSLENRPFWPFATDAP
ncbi:MAG: hypothetical protein F4027_16045 [Rhodospirillaceae bacterium]|nr:hypothetical protein [Rhodospirillaceae bacterium]MYH36708.1 hypothetical protein [Rhodospirillaceae bacterium]MYK12640.1 hypothetical protein [Rhodospirillaceae bacterium]MYK60029.1 hypothetical protein [Rhodospirillaceae bacterium]